MTDALVNIMNQMGMMPPSASPQQPIATEPHPGVQVLKYLLENVLGQPMAEKAQGKQDAGALTIEELSQRIMNPSLMYDEPQPMAAEIDPLAGKVLKAGKTAFKKAAPQEYIAARSTSKRPEFLTPYKETEMENWQLSLTDEGVGYAITDEADIVGVFNNSTKRGAGKEAVIDAIGSGGKTLDCFDGFLDTYYKKFGFKLKERVNWDPQYAPKDWNYEKYGSPSVSFWEYPEGLSREAGDIRKRLKSSGD